MDIRVWLNQEHEFRPGAELFRSDRMFQVASYVISHSQLLLSSDRDANRVRCETTVQILFKPVEAVQIQECYRGLVISCATDAEAELINKGVSDYGYRDPSAHVFVLESQGVRGYVVSLAIGWQEGVLPRMQPSFFNRVSAVDDVLPTGPLGGWTPGLDRSSPAEIVQALATGLDDDARRDRHGYVYTLLAKDTRGGGWHAVGVFLAEADAAEAAQLLRPKVLDCRIETVPLVF